MQKTYSRVTFKEQLKSYPGLEIKKLEFILKLKIKRNNWLLADTCPQAANRFVIFSVSDCNQVL